MQVNIAYKQSKSKLHRSLRILGNESKKQVKLFGLIPYENVTESHTKNSSQSNFYLLSKLNTSSQC